MNSPQPPIDTRISISHLPFELLSIIMRYLPQRERAALSLASRQLKYQFPDESPTYFAEKFGIHAIDRLFQKRSNDELFVDFAKRMISKMPNEFKAALMNQYARKQEWAKVQFMIENNVDPSLLAYSIRRAARNGLSEDLDRLRKLLREFIDIDAIINSRLNLQQLSELLKPWARQIRAYNCNIQIPLQGSYKYKLERLLEWASEKNQLAVIESLLSSGVDIHWWKDYALREASVNGHLEVVRLLLDHGADVHAMDDLALCWACHSGKLDVVKLLIERGADVRANNNEALRLASSAGQLEIMRLLIDLGAQANELMIRQAELYGRREVANILRHSLSRNN